MQTVVLCAGISSRLYPLTQNIPKPMLPIRGKPIIEYVISNLAKNGFTDIIITLHYQPKSVIDYFGNGRQWGVNITYSYEEKLLGTAGSLLLLQKKLQYDQFLVCSGSYVLFNVDLNKVADEHAHNGAIATVLFGSAEERWLHLYGQGVIDTDGYLLKFSEKPKENFSNLIHTTYQFFDPKIFDFIDYNKVPCNIPYDVIPNLIRRKSVRAHILDQEAYWFNISTIDLYEKLIDTVSRDRNVRDLFAI